jgi:hypothetical protein
MDYVVVVVVVKRKSVFYRQKKVEKLRYVTIIHILQLNALLYCNIKT